MRLRSIEDVRFRPIVDWPGVPTTNPKRSPFRASYSETIDRLDLELHALGAERVVIQLALEERHIRQDGLPRANAPEPRHPGVIVAFDSKHGPLRYATDRFDRWKDNLRAIALGLEALRKVERYGIANDAEQYRGWRAIAERSDAEEAFRSEDDAAAFVAGLTVPRAGEGSSNVTAAEYDRRVAFLLGGADDTCRPLVRQAQRAAHPDTGGSDDLFRKLTLALERLGLA